MGFTTKAPDFESTLFFTAKGKEIIRLDSKGDIFLHGRLIEKDIELVDALHEFLQSQGFNFQDSMIGKVQKLVNSESNDMKLGSKIRNLFNTK